MNCLSQMFSMDYVFKPIDGLLNKIPMYRVVLYGLIIMVLYSFVVSVIGKLPYDVVSLFIHLLVITISCVITNSICSFLFKAPTNTESTAITALILFFLLWPLTSPTNIAITALAGLIAMTSKYVIAYKKIHVFNPAALSIFILGLFGFGNAIWWAGSEILLPVTVIVGFLIVRKIRRFHLVVSFISTALFLISMRQLLRDIPLNETLLQLILSDPLIFFATVMLTEPLSTPPKKELQILYGVIVGILYSLQFHIGPLYSTPEFALLAGNVVSYIISKKQRVVLTLIEKKLIGEDMYDYVFESNVKLHFQPGQYLEWQLPHEKVDSRGNRRYFTIASSPTESTIRLGVKIPHNSSSFKGALKDFEYGDSLIVSQYAGDFLLPEDSHKKMVFIAGGIGITPFRSMVKFLIDTHQKRDIILLYTSSTENGFIYKDFFDNTKKIGVYPIYSVTKADYVSNQWKGHKGYITKELITQKIPDYEERIFYISGPQTLVTNYKILLKRLNIPDDQIITDYFPGF